MTVFSSAVLEIEFSAGVWTDVSAYYRCPVRIRQGRATLFEDIGAAVLTVRLDNPDGRFMPENTGSPYYPNVVRAKRIRWKVTKSAVTYTRFVGWIQSWEPKFPSGSIADSYVNITATDALGLLAQRRLYSNWAETGLYYARNTSTTADVYEITDTSSAYGLQFVNVSTDAGALAAFTRSTGTLAPAFNAGDVALSAPGFLEIPVDAENGSSQVTEFGVNFRAPQEIDLIFRTPAAYMPTTTASQYYMVTGWRPGGGTSLFSIYCEFNTADNLIQIYSQSPLTFRSTLAIAPKFSTWYRLMMRASNTTAGRTDFMMTEVANSGASYQSNNVAGIDVTAAGQLTFGDNQFSAEAAYTGVMALGTKTFVTADGTARMAGRARTAASGVMTARITDLQHAVNQLPISWTIVGTDSTTVCTGDWTGRFALDVGTEMMRSARGILWARGRDSQVLAVMDDQLRPKTPAVTIDCEGDMLGALALASGTEQVPTRVQVQSAAVSQLMVDATAEAGGEIRPLPISTVNGLDVQASAVGVQYLKRSAGLRIGQVTVDLVGAVSDPTATLFDESTTLGGLYPTQRMRLSNLPTTHFATGAYDFFVEGWTEEYSEDTVTLVMDTSRAPISLATETWTGSNGSAWPGQWTTGATGTGGSALIQSNQGRITAGTVASAKTSRRLAATYTDVEFLFTVTFGAATGDAKVCWRADSTLLSTGYNFMISPAANTVFIFNSAGGGALENASFAMSAATAYTCRVRAVGAYMSAKIWATAGAEPAAPQIEIVDRSVSAAGYVGLVGTNDGTATARTFDFDNFTLYEGQL